MSTFSSWSYTATATFWAPTLDAYGQPSSWVRTTAACSFKAGGKLALDSTGEEFVPMTAYYMEAADVDAPSVGWKVTPGDVAGAAPVDAAETVRTVRKFDPSTFGEGLPDLEVLTG